MMHFSSGQLVNHIKKRLAERRGTLSAENITPDYRVYLEAEIASDEIALAALESNKPPLEVLLPEPDCTYADHSYPAYSKRQVVALLETLGVKIKEDEE
ncbi:hypothetical protein DNY71_22570 [Salmonella enterica subsp. enterica serovar Typhimurium]|nr:hypothetical protein [Salmonella enterica subsp. enterica serovar Typhimurium]HDX3169201.1 hypothetical protein [Escherichia coli]HDX3205913.1 hypothetical protein [Escherichia coli]